MAVGKGSIRRATQTLAEDKDTVAAEQTQATEAGDEQKAKKPASAPRKKSTASRRPASGAKKTTKRTVKKKKSAGVPIGEKMPVHLM